MINRNGVHLPDTTYGGNTIDWNCSSDSDDILQRLTAENAKLRELMGDVLRYINRPCDGSWTHLRAKKERDRINERARELRIEVQE